MMGVVRVKEGVQFTTIAPGGFRILAAIDRAAKSYHEDIDLVITSACDGAHSGPEDPHHRGEAYDVRSKGFDSLEKIDVLAEIKAYLEHDHFYAFLESPDTDNEHFHIQVKKGTVYP